MQTTLLCCSPTFTALCVCQTFSFWLSKTTFPLFFPTEWWYSLQHLALLIGLIHKGPRLGPLYVSDFLRRGGRGGVLIGKRGHAMHQSFIFKFVLCKDSIFCTLSAPLLLIHCCCCFFSILRIHPSPYIINLFLSHQILMPRAVAGPPQTCSQIKRNPPLL